MKSTLKKAGFVLIIFGLLLIANSFLIVITGNVVSETSKITSSILGLIFVIIGLGLFMAEPAGKLEKIAKEEPKLISAVKKDETIFKLAKKIPKNGIIQREINHLLEELNKGNINPGIGTKKLFGSISYLRSENGARVFYRPFGNQYEILGYAIGTGQGTGKSQHERRVIKRLEELYQHR